MEVKYSGHILIVDDLNFMRRQLGYIVKGIGYEVREACDGANAIYAMEQAVPELVLLDLMLPDKSGIEVCRWMREREATRDVPVIVCTANQERKTLEKVIRAGATDILVKPVSRKGLQDRLARHLPATA